MYPYRAHLEEVLQYANGNEGQGRGNHAPPPEPFHIVCSNNDQGALMNVGVCVNEPLRTKLQEEEITDPFLLVVVRRGNRDVQRDMIELAKGHLHVTFNGPGEYTVATMVVYPEGGSSVTKMKRLLLEKSFGRYETEVFSEYESELTPHSSFSGSVGTGRLREHVYVGSIGHHSSRQVIVSANNFADPPAAWRVAAVRWFFPDNDRDQCHLRQRSLWSIPLTLFVLPLHYLAKLVGITLCLLTGLVYGLNVKPAWRPVRNGSLETVFGGVNVHETWWWYRRKGEYRYEARDTTWNVLITLTGLVLLGSIPAWLIGEHGGYLGALWFVTKIGLGIFGALLVLAGTFWFVEDVLHISNQRERFRAWRKLRREEAAKSDLERLDQQLETMSCESRGGQLTIEQLVARRRFAPVVVYHGIKDKVCKPYARG